MTPEVRALIIKFFDLVLEVSIEAAKILAVVALLIGYSKYENSKAREPKPFSFKSDVEGVVCQVYNGAVSCFHDPKHTYDFAGICEYMKPNWNKKEKVK